MPLQSLGTSALMRNDYPAAQKFYTQAVEVNEKAFGESSDKVADSLRILSRIYFEQKQFDQAEPILLRAVKIDESLFGRDGSGLLLPLAALCGLYDNWGKPDKSEPCDRKLLAVLEKQFGENSLQIVPILNTQPHPLPTLPPPPEPPTLPPPINSITPS